ncbi:MAG: hypothetical protein ACLR7Z_05475 [Bilophila wadsworthia]
MSVEKVLKVRRWKLWSPGCRGKDADLKPAAWRSRSGRCRPTLMLEDATVPRSRFPPCSRRSTR